MRLQNNKKVDVFSVAAPCVFLSRQMVQCCSFTWQRETMEIKELILETNSIQKTKLFYHKTLELAICDEREDLISFEAGKSQLTFKQANAGKPFYHIAFNVINNKFSDSFEWINSKLDILPVADGMLIAGYDDWHAQSFYFYDNNGSIVEFIARFDLPYHSGEPFSSKCVTEISEIGLVVDDVQHTAERLHVQGIPYFVKGPQLHDFIAMGDEYGLLLVCAHKRGWVPTHKPAQPFPVTIKDSAGTVFSF